MIKFQCQIIPTTVNFPCKRTYMSRVLAKMRPLAENSCINTVREQINKGTEEQRKREREREREKERERERERESEVEREKKRDRERKREREIERERDPCTQTDLVRTKTEIGKKETEK